MKKIVYLILLSIIISNVVSVPSIGKGYSYESINCEFKYRTVPSKGRSIDQMLREFEKYKESENSDEIILYRTFKMQPFKFWHWREYLTKERWSFPYKEPCSEKK